MFETKDGVVHRTERAAREYANKLYGDALTKLAHKLCKLTECKYSKITEVLDSKDTQDEFLKIIELREDFILEEEEDD